MKFRLLQKQETLAAAYTVYSEPIPVGALGGDSFSVQAFIDAIDPDDIDVPSADITFEDDNWNYADHGLFNGLKVQVSTSDTLPDPLMATTDYYVIVVDADNFKLAASLSDALAGTAITLADAGVGDQTIEPQAIAGGSIKLQQSNVEVPGDNDWSDLGSATNITVDATVYLEKDRPTSLWIRVAQALTSGYVSTELNLLVKGDKE